MQALKNLKMNTLENNIQALNKGSYRLIFDFKFGENASLSFSEAEQLVNEKVDGAEFWDSSKYGKNFRNRTAEELKQGNETYLYTYDCWCPYSKTWINAQVVTYNAYEDQTFVDFNKLIIYMSDYAKAQGEIDQPLIQEMLVASIRSMGAYLKTSAQALEMGIAGRSGYLLPELEQRFTELKFTLDNLQDVEPSVMNERRYSALKMKYAEQKEPNSVKRLNERLEELQREESRIRGLIKDVRNTQSENAAKNLQIVSGIEVTELDFTALVQRIQVGSDYINAGIVHECLGAQSDEDFYKMVSKLIELNILARCIRYNAYDDEPYQGYREDLTLTEERYTQYCQPEPETGEYGCPLTGEVISKEEFDSNIYFTYSTTAKYAEAVAPYFF
ncbi:hypothetical protein [Acinetobacter calcoaceticus]